MASDSHIALLEADPDIGRYLTPDERALAAALTVPCVSLPAGPVDVADLLTGNGCFGAFVLEGMLAAHLRIGEQAGMRILGPGDLVPFGAPPSMLLAEWGCRAAVPTRLAMLGRDVLVGVHRWPRLMAGLHARTAEQIERVAAQLAICQLPRVEDRLLAFFWLLAEQWGRVTPTGTILPMTLTHETLGALVGARRPTVTLALGELAERGALLRQGKVWLLVEHPAAPTPNVEAPHTPGLLTPSRGSVWGTREALEATLDETHGAMMANVERLRLQHLESSGAMRAGLARVRRSRERSQEIRDRVREARIASGAQRFHHHDDPADVAVVE